MSLIPQAYALDLNDPNVWPFAQKFGTFADIISKLLPTILLVAAFIFFILVIVAGFTFLSSAGSSDAHAKEKWREILTYGAIGLIIILSAYWVMQIINAVTFGSLGDLFK